MLGDLCTDPRSAAVEAIKVAGPMRLDWVSAGVLHVAINLEFSGVEC